MYPGIVGSDYINATFLDVSTGQFIGVSCEMSCSPFRATTRETSIFLHKVHWRTQLVTSGGWYGSIRFPV